MYTCSDYIFCFLLSDFYNGFYENCLYNGFYYVIDIGIKRGVFNIRDIWKGYKQKIVLGIFRFVSMLF